MVWWKTKHRFYCKCLAEFNGERILRIGQRMPKVCANVEWHALLTKSVVRLSISFT